MQDSLNRHHIFSFEEEERMTIRGKVIFPVSSPTFSRTNSCLEHEKMWVGWTYKSLILNRRSPLISHSIDGYVLGWHWAGQYHYIAFIHRIAITLQLCNEACVFCIFKEFPHFPIILIAWRDIMLLLATFAVATYFPEIHRNSNKITISHHLGVQSPGTQTVFFSAFLGNTRFSAVCPTPPYMSYCIIYILLSDRYQLTTVMHF